MKCTACKEEIKRNENVQLAATTESNNTSTDDTLTLTPPAPPPITPAAAQLEAHVFAAELAHVVWGQSKNSAFALKEARAAECLRKLM